MIDLALLGCAHIHTPGFIDMIKKRDDVRVTRVFDADPRRSEVRAKQLGATVAESVEAVLADGSIQGAIVCTETIRHAGLVEQVAGAGKHLFVEKPLGFATADAYKMAAAIEKAGVLFQTGYFSRSDAKIRYIKKLVDDKALGKITRVRGSNCHSGALGRWFDPKPDDVANDWRWMADPTRAGCGAFGDLGTHALDILIWLVGDVESVAGQLDLGTKAYEGCDETGEALIKFKSGVLGTLAAGWDDVANPLTYLVSGTEGHAAIVNGKLYVKTKSLDGATPVADADLPAPAPHAFELFLDALAGKPPAVPLVKPHEAAYRNAVMEAIYIATSHATWEQPMRA